MKDFVSTLSNSDFSELFTLDSFQEAIAVLHVHGNGKDVVVHRTEPSRYKIVVFMLIEQGYMDLRIDYKDYRLEANTLLHIVPAHVVESIVLSSDLQLYMVLAGEEFLHENRTSDKPFPIEFILSSRHSPATPIPEQYMPMLIARLKGLQHDIRRTEHLFQKVLVKNDFSSFAFELGHIIHQQWKDQFRMLNLDHKEDIMGQFMFLVTHHCKQKHNVSFYANKLCMSPEHLSRILKQVSGTTANKWIARVLITEIKILLKNQELSIQQIADEIGFADQSSLSKFFKKNCGISPLAYRETKRGK